MTRTTLALTEKLWLELAGWLAEEHEVAGVLTARIIDDGTATTLLARQLDRAPDDAYVARRHDGLSLGSAGWVLPVRESRRDEAMALFVHTHPKGAPRFSQADDLVDEQLFRPFVENAGAPIYGALVLAGDTQHPEIAGRIIRDSGEHAPIDTFRVVGDRLTILRSGNEAATDAAFERQLRALGRSGQRVLNGMRVGVVGAGGTGSPVAEQLIRLGIGSLVIIDDDVVTPTTVARGYGSGTCDVGRAKVEVLAELAKRIGLGTTVTAVRGNLREAAIAQALRHCDVVFCCVDGHSARFVLNRWAYGHLAPVIDVAVLISSDAGLITGIDGRITWLAPGTTCLLCRGRIDPTAAHAEQLDPRERRQLAEQGYAPALEEPQPSVVTYTTLMAGYAVTELLNRLFGLADSTPTEILLQLHERSIRHNRVSPREGCFCQQPASSGCGLNEPYLNLTWPEPQP